LYLAEVYKCQGCSAVEAEAVSEEGDIRDVFEEVRNPAGLLNLPTIESEFTFQLFEVIVPFHG